MKKSLIKKALVCGIIVLFVGSGIISGMSGSRNTLRRTKDTINVENQGPDQINEEKVSISEYVRIDEDGSCSVDLWLNLSTSYLADNYCSAMFYDEVLGGVQNVSESVIFEDSQSIVFNDSIESYSGDNETYTIEEIQVNSTFREGIYHQQRLSLGINITEFLTVQMERMIDTNLFVVYVHANGYFLHENQSDGNWTISVGPSNLNESIDRTNFILTQIAFIQEMLGNISGDQVYNKTWTTVFQLPPTAILTNDQELSNKQWDMDFGNGTEMHARIFPCTPSSRVVVLTETMIVGESDITTTEPKELVESGFLCFKIFNIKYHLPFSGLSCDKSFDICDIDDFRWSIDLTILKIENQGFIVYFKEPDDGKIKINMTIRFSLALKAHMDFRTKWFKLRRFRIWMEFDGNVDVHSWINATEAEVYNKTWEQSIYEWNSTRRYSFYVGPVLVWVTPYFEVAAKLNVRVNGSFQIECGANASGTLKVGVGWKKGKGPYGILNAEMDVDKFGPQWDHDTEIKVTPSLGFRPKLLFYDIVGPAVELEPFATFTVPGDPENWTIEVGLNANAGVGFSNWFKKLTKLRDLYWNIVHWVFWKYPHDCHDVGIKAVRTPDKGLVTEITPVYVDVVNKGNHTDTVNVTLYYRKEDNDTWTEIGNTTIYNLEKRHLNTTTIMWDTSNIEDPYFGNYDLKAKAAIQPPPREGDGDEDDNTCYGLIYLDVKNICITDVDVSTNQVSQGADVEIYVTVENPGSVNVSVLPVFVYYNESPISDVWCKFGQWIFDLQAGSGAVCGDCNDDGTVNIGDVVKLINYLYRSGPPPDPLVAGDVNNDGIIDIGDVVYLINYLYRGGDPPICRFFEKLTFTWNTKDVPEGTYTIHAEAPVLENETNPNDNIFYDGTVEVVIWPT